MISHRTIEKGYTQMPIYATIMIGFILLSHQSLCGQSVICQKAADIYATTASFHISPKPLDDSLSADIFSNFIDNLDPNKVVFTDEDFNNLSQYQYVFDEVIQGKSCHVIDEIIDFYIIKADQLRKNISSLTGEDIRLNTIYTLEFINNNYNTAAVLSQKWKQIFKLRVLMQIADQDSTILENAIPKSQIDEALESIIATELCVIDDKYEFENKEERKKTLYNDFLSAIAISMDPHTAYMTMDEKESFLESLQTETLSFGFALSTNIQGEYEIMNLVPGGPAWNSNAIEEHDLLIGILNKEGETIKADCRNITQISEQLQSSEIREITFLIKNKLGKLVEVSLSKDFEIVDDNVIQSFILKGENRIGYIQLPSFYSSSDSYNGTINGCTDHLARELIRLQQEKIDGLILDLRFNGGGSILEAIRMGGMFINYGPIAIAEYKGEKPETLKDIDRGRAYRGPLTILVNSFSASASELFAGAMQDYNRAVIVGSPTHGKGSIQSIIPTNAYELDDKSTEDDVSSDFLKTTIGKYYRITGDGVQQAGIKPDILVPDLFDLDIFRESNNTNALSYSTIDKKTYYKPLKELPIEELAKNSNDRMTINSDVETILNHKKAMLVEQQNPHMVLSLAEIRSLQNENKYEYELITKGEYKASVPSYKQKSLQQNQRQKKLSQQIRDRLKSDLQIIEAFKITTELISITNR